MQSVRRVSRASRPASPATAWLLPGLAALICFGALSGCNVFSPLAADQQGDLSYRGLILRGNKAINRGEYEAAESYFMQAKALNPRGSEAYLFHSKALMSRYGLDFHRLNGEFEDHREKDGVPGKSGIPFIDTNTTLAGVDSIYYPVSTSVTNLEHILRQKRDTIRLDDRWVLPPDGDTASDGKISTGVAILDLGLLQAVKAMLAPMDLDSNNRIDNQCGRNVCQDLDEACMAGAVYRDRCKDGPESEAIRLANFKKLTRNIKLDSLGTDGVRARNVSTNPNDINRFIDAIQGPIAGSTFNLDSVNGALNSHKETDLSKQLSGIVGNIKDLNGFLGYMRYNDALDNDFDSQKKPRTAMTAMVWQDFDKDGGIKFNYADSVAFFGYPPAAGNIGHPLHRLLRPGLYQTFKEYEATFPDLKADTSNNSRLAMMRKHCREVVDEMPVSGNVTPSLKSALSAETCVNITPVLKDTVRPPAVSDWISGTAGVDEEMVDDRDNDYDGLKDEDARNARGLDDDDDALLNVLMAGGPPVAPMVWKDEPGHVNRCPDIDTTKPMLPPPLQRQFCIGSLEHRIYLAHNYGRDSLDTHYSTFPEEGANANCLDDYTKLDQAYKDLVKPTTLEVRLACEYKHIWIFGRPPDSEWTSGVLGIDEEIMDGVDNDGDGWIDEDLK